MQGRDGDRERRSPYLPTGYRLDDETDPDFAVLRREDGSEVAAFGERADPKEMERAAWEDFRGRGKPARKPDGSDLP